MQPKWRSLGNDWPPNREGPPGETWANLNQGGPIGLLLVMMTLSWWIGRVKTEKEKTVFWSSFEDVNWALHEVKKTYLMSSSKKRAADDDADGQPNSKR